MERHSMVKGAKRLIDVATEQGAPSVGDLLERLDEGDMQAAILYSKHGTRARWRATLDDDTSIDLNRIGSLAPVGIGGCKFVTMSLGISFQALLSSEHVLPLTLHGIPDDGLGFLLPDGRHARRIVGDWWEVFHDRGLKPWWADRNASPPPERYRPEGSEPVRLQDIWLLPADLAKLAAEVAALQAPRSTGRHEENQRLLAAMMGLVADDRSKFWGDGRPKWLTVANALQDSSHPDAIHCIANTLRDRLRDEVWPLSSQSRKPA